MKSSFTFIKMRRFESVEEHSQQTLDRIIKIFNRPLKGHFTFSKEGYEHSVSLTLTGKNLHFKAESRGENLFATIEEAVEKVGRQLAKKKHKMKSHRNKKSLGELNNLVYLDDYRRKSKLKRRTG